MSAESINIKESSTPADVEGWDSLKHIELIINIEAYYNIKFTTTEIMGLVNIGTIIGLINKKIDL